MVVMGNTNRFVLCMPKRRDGKAIRRAREAFDADVGVVVDEEVFVSGAVVKHGPVEPWMPPDELLTPVAELSGESVEWRREAVHVPFSMWDSG
jgi:hypothetical protein